MTLRARLVAVLAAVMVAGACGAASAHAAVSLVPVGSFRFPVAIAAPPGDPARLFVVERAGRIQLLQGGVQSTFLDLTGQVKSTDFEQGLLSLAFAPDYAASGTFYVFYTAPPAVGTQGDDLVVAAGHSADGVHADPSLRTILRIPHRTDDQENGGQLQIGPDGLLWIGTGAGSDHDSAGNAQRLDPATDDAVAGRSALLGKLLRIDPTPGVGCGGGCTIPAGNPGFAQPEVWAYGLRNPWRFSFDAQTGDLILGDVGASDFEEVDFAPAPGRGAGANYGFNAIEGTQPLAGGGPLAPPGVTPVAPVLALPHAAPLSFRAVVGGFVVRDPALPELAGRYLYADYAQGAIRAVTLRPGAATGDTDTGLRVPGGLLTSFGQDGCGRVYVAAQGGTLFRLTQTGACGGPPAPAGPAPGAGPGPSPALSVRAAAVQHVLRTGSVLVRAGCAVACRVRARGTFLVTRRAASGRAAATRPLRTLTVTRTVAAGAAPSLRLRVSATTRRAVRRALLRGRSVTVLITVTATDAGGTRHTGTARSRVPLR